MLFLQNFCFSFIYLYVGVCGSWDIRYIFHWKLEMQRPNAHPSRSYIFLRSIPATSTLNWEAKWSLFRALKLASPGRDRSRGSLLGGSRVYQGTSRNRERGWQGRRMGRSKMSKWIIHSRIAFPQECNIFHYFYYTCSSKCKCLWESSGMA